MSKVCISVGGTHQQEQIKKLAEENGIPVLCICGTCTVDQEDATELRRLLRKILAQSAALQQIKTNINTEMFLINVAAAGCVHEAETVETRLRRVA